MDRLRVLLALVFPAHLLCFWFLELALGNIVAELTGQSVLAWAWCF